MNLNRVVFFLGVQALLTVSNAFASVITIIGSVKGLHSTEVYLTDAYSKEIIDSAKNTDHFEFNYRFDRKTFEPFLVSILYNNKKNILFFSNNILVNKNLGDDAFMLEPGKIFISGDLAKNIKLDIKAGPETDAMFATDEGDFGFLGKATGSERQQKITTYKNVIRKFPFSYFLLAGIVRFEHQYSKNELKEIVGLFDPNVQRSKKADKIRSYLKNGPENGIPYSPLFVVNTKLKRESISYKLNKVTVLVFWASWCAPCRAEIPRLKQLFNIYEDKGIRIISISTDRKSENWKKAMDEENMPWEQFVVDYKDLREIQDRFNFSAIPTSIIIDRNGMNLKQYTGMDDIDFRNCVAFLDKYLKNN